MNLENIKAPYTLGGVSYILLPYMNSTKEVLSHLEVELYKQRIISLVVDTDRDCVSLR